MRTAHLSTVGCVSRVCVHTPPPTDTCENITLPQASFAGSNNIGLNFDAGMNFVTC